MENLSRVFQNKKEKKNMKRLSFIISQFKIEFLLLLTGCRKVLEKMLAEGGYRGQSPFLCPEGK